MYNFNLISGIILTLISAGTCLMAYRLGLGTGGNPGPGFLAFGIASLLGLMSLYLSLAGIAQLARGYREKQPFKGLRWKRALLIILVLTAYAVFLNVLGFAVSAFLVMMAMFSIARQRLHRVLILSLVTVISAHVLFVVLFGLPLPQGTLWRFFGD
jgi:hypothetical protein